MDPLTLSVVEKAELTRRATARGGDAPLRARVILMLARGETWEAIIRKLGCSRGFVARWSQRFRAYRMAGLIPRQRGGKSPMSFARRMALERAILEQESRDAGRQSTRQLAARLGVSHMTIHRLRQRHLRKYAR